VGEVLDGFDAPGEQPAGNAAGELGLVLEVDVNGTGERSFVLRGVDVRAGFLAIRLVRGRLVRVVS
jgi:hypothetical protein